MKRIILSCISSIICITSASASISTYPMRVELEAGGNIGSVTVMNSSDKAVNIQVRAMQWTQNKSSGEKKLEDTKELIFFPKIFKVKGKGQQIVRVGYKGKVEGEEKSFRLFVRELPVDEPGMTGTRFAVQISMPAFIYAKGSVQPVKPEIKAIEVEDGKLVARIENHAERYYSMHTLEISGSKAGQATYTGNISGWYVLAGVSKLFPLNISRSDCLSMDSMHLVAKTREGQSTADFAVNAMLCGQINKVEAK